MADSFLVLVPHKTLHGTISILIQRPKLATNVGKMGAVKTKCLSSPMPRSRTKCSGGDAGDGRFSKPTLFHSQGHETPCGIASAAVPWKWALEAQSKAQFSADWDAETMQNMCRVLPFWRELFLGTHADHPKPCRADPSCSPETQGVQAGYARRRKRRDHAKAAVLLDNATSPVAI